MLENILWYWALFLFFYFGAIIGSFLNVLALELEPTVFEDQPKKSFWARINRRSRCPTCGHKLNFWELFPVFSYIFLRGKCSQCQAKISPRYFIVEIFSGTIFALLFWKLFQGSFDLVFLIEFLSLTFVFSGLIIISIFDAKHKIIPSEVYVPTLIFTLIYLALNGLIFDYHIFLRAAVAALPFYLIWFISKGKWMGYADWKLVFLLALLLPSGVYIYSFLTLAFWIAAITFVPVLLKKQTVGIEVPFGPFLVIGFLIVFFFNINIIETIQSFLSNFY